MRRFLLALVSLMSVLATANSLDRACEAVKAWAPGEPPPKAEILGDEIQFVDLVPALALLEKSNWVLIDTRGDKERSQGFFENVISLRAGVKTGDPDDLSLDVFKSKIQNARNKPSLNLAEIKKLNFILFCNGEKCPKSPRAACAMRSWGFRKNQIKVLPVSYEELYANGLPLYIKGSRLKGIERDKLGAVTKVVIRLLPGMDLKKSLSTLQKTLGLKASAVISAVGSLKTASLRFADLKESTQLEGPFEIVSLGGTLSENGAHLHLSVSDSAGKTLGGHLSEGSIVYTTAEITIAESNSLVFRREKDSRTEFEELFIDENK